MVEWPIMPQQLKKTQIIFQSLKDENSAWSDIRVIVVDKDFTQNLRY